MSEAESGRRWPASRRERRARIADAGAAGETEPLPPAERLWYSRPRAVFRLTLAFAWMALLLPFQLLVARFGWPGRVAIPQLYHRGTCRLLGIEVATVGERPVEGPVLFVCNHLSYLDISVLGSALRASFVAKAEVGGWPVFGTLARLQRTVFVRRDRRRAQEDLAEVARRLAAGDRLILFAEGTSGDGLRVLPFKSTLLAAVAGRMGEAGHSVPIQPVSLAFTHVDGIPAGRALQPFYAWYGDMTLVPHLTAFAGLGRVRVQITFHPPIDPAEATDRKALTHRAHAAVAAGFETARRTPI